jgi:hypothetical protein
LDEVEVGERAVENGFAQPADGALAAPIDGQPAADTLPASLSRHPYVHQATAGRTPDFGRRWPHSDALVVDLASCEDPCAVVVRGNEDLPDE